MSIVVLVWREKQSPVRQLCIQKWTFLGKFGSKNDQSFCNVHNVMIQETLHIPGGEEKAFLVPQESWVRVRVACRGAPPGDVRKGPAPSGKIAKMWNLCEAGAKSCRILAKTRVKKIARGWHPLKTALFLARFFLAHFTRYNFEQTSLSCSKLIQLWAENFERLKVVQVWAASLSSSNMYSSSRTVHPGQWEAPCVTATPARNQKLAAKKLMIVFVLINVCKKALQPNALFVRQTRIFRPDETQFVQNGVSMTANIFHQDWLSYW